MSFRELSLSRRAVRDTLDEISFDEIPFDAKIGQSKRVGRITRTSGVDKIEYT